MGISPDPNDKLISLLFFQHLLQNMCTQGNDYPDFGYHDCASCLRSVIGHYIE